MAEVRVGKAMRSRRLLLEIASQVRGERSAKGVTVLHFRVPPDLIWRTGLITLVGVLVAIDYFLISDQPIPNWETARPLVILVSAVIAMTVLDLHVRSVYSVWYDQHSLYQRDAGIFRVFSVVNSLEFSQIHEITADDIALGSGRIQAIILKSQESGQEIKLALEYLREHDVIALLRLLEVLTKADMHEVVRKYLVERS